MKDKGIQKRFDDVSRSKVFKNLVIRHGLGKSAVLDIGCSFGEFLAHFGEGSHGVSISHEEVAYGQANNLPITYGNIETDTFSFDHQFDYVYANNILEHLYSPHAFLIKLRKFVKPEGKIIIGVPCVPTIIPLVRFKKFRGTLAQQHINFFTQYTFQKTIERAGWIVEYNGLPHFKVEIFNKPLNCIAPHTYVVARKDSSFTYNEKRLKELAGYTGIEIL